MDFKTALKRHLDAIINRDLAAFAEFLCPKRKCVVILPHGAYIEGYDEILDFHKEWFADTDWRMDIKEIDVSEIGGTGYALLDITYHDLNELGEPYVMHYFLSLLFENVDGKWILLRDQNTLK